MARIYSTGGLFYNRDASTTRGFREISDYKSGPTTFSFNNIIRLTIGASNPVVRFNAFIYLTAYRTNGDGTPKFTFSQRGWYVDTGGNISQVIDNVIHENSDASNLFVDLQNRQITLQSYTYGTAIDSSIKVMLLCDRWDFVTISYP